MIKMLQTRPTRRSPEVASVTAGIYAYVAPIPDAALSLRRLFLEKGESFVQYAYSARGLHCTLVYDPASERHEDVIDYLPLCKPNYLHKARVSKLHVFQKSEEDNADLVVLLDNCPTLHELHEKWLDAGFVHSFPDFLPHTTIGKSIPPEEADKVRKLCKELNAQEIFHLMPITFYGESVDYSI